MSVYMEVINTPYFCLFFRGEFRIRNNKCATFEMPARADTNKCYPATRAACGKILSPRHGGGHGYLYSDVL